MQMNPGLKSSARVEAGGIPIPIFLEAFSRPFLSIVHKLKLPLLQEIKLILIELFFLQV